MYYKNAIIFALETLIDIYALENSIINKDWEYFTSNLQKTYVYPGVENVINHYSIYAKISIVTNYSREIVQKLLNFHNKINFPVTTCVREYDFQVPFGVVESQKNKVIKIVEKPIHKFFVNAGIYVLSSNTVKSIRKHQQLDMPDLLNLEIEKGHNVASFPLHEYWLDIGRIDEFNQAQKDIKGVFFW